MGITIYNNRVYVADQLTFRICVFLCDGAFTHAIAQLTLPTDVAINNNQLLIASGGNKCISVFTLDGNHVNKVGAGSISKGQLIKPAYLTTDKYGFILSTEKINNRVSVFDKDGVFVHCFASKGSAIGQFSYPRGIALSPNGRIYISDHENKRIQIF